MVSLRGRVFRLVLKWKSNFNPIVHPNLVETVKRGFDSLCVDVPKKGYTIIHKETENKTRYVILKKDSNKPAKKVIYYLHGGIYILGLLNIYYSFGYEFCDIRDDIEVVLLDYDTAPEFKYPTQFNQAIEVWNEITKEHRPEDIIVGGDSAGGNLALILTLKLQKEYNVSPKACFFLSPWADMTWSGKTLIDNYQKDILLGESNSPMTEEKKLKFIESEIHSYLGDADRKDPYISPVFADYSAFPKSLFVIGLDEILLDNTTRIVDKLKENGKDVELFSKEGMFHVFPIYFQYIPESREALDRIKEFINENFN